MKKIRVLWCCVLLPVLLCAACSSWTQSEEGKLYNIYYVNNEETKNISVEYHTQTEDAGKLISELLEQLSLVPPKFEYEAPLAGSFEILDYALDNGKLTINFDTNYKGMDSVKEVLTRAAVVRTLTQIQGVDYVAFTVQGDLLTDSSGIAIGTMTSDLFIDNAGNEINAYESVDLHLYFANEEGTGLVEESRRNVVYSSNISLEKLVVEKLVEGPVSVGAYPTMSPSTKIISVTVTDGTCYVNLDETFLIQPYTTSAEVTIYSITNSLVELSNINKVQITINGETNLSYREKFNLNEVFERNLDLLAVSEEK